MSAILAMTVSPGDGGGRNPEGTNVQSSSRRCRRVFPYWFWRGWRAHITPRQTPPPLPIYIYQHRIPQKKNYLTSAKTCAYVRPILIFHSQKEREKILLKFLFGEFSFSVLFLVIFFGLYFGPSSVPIFGLYSDFLSLFSSFFCLYSGTISGPISSPISGHNFNPILGPHLQN